MKRITFALTATAKSRRALSNRYVSKTLQLVRGILND